MVNWAALIRETAPIMRPKITHLTEYSLIGYIAKL